MLHACVQRFDMTGNLEKFCKILETKQAPTQLLESSARFNHSVISHRKLPLCFVFISNEFSGSGITRVFFVSKNTWPGIGKMSDV